MIRTFFLAALLTSAGQLAPAHATSTETSVSSEVSFADLDPSTQPGRARLDARIRTTVARMCSVADPLDLRQVINVGRCRSTAQADVAPKIAALIDRNQRLAASGTGQHVGG